MTKNRMLSSVVLASILGLGALSSAIANPDCGPGDFWKHRAEHRAEHQQKLHEALKLSPDQEGAWKKLMASEPPMAKMEPPSREEWAKLTTPERADKMLAHMKEREARMTEHVAAMKEFYAVLTPEQKKTFDDFHVGPRGEGRGRPKH